MSDWEPTETVYEHASGNDTFTVSACERWSKAMITRLKEKHPDEVDVCHVNKDGSIVAHIPFEWMRIVPKRKDTLTDEQREERRERIKSLHRARLTENDPQIED